MGGNWTGLAHLLADDIREPGFAAAALCASAWAARVDPQACHGLVGAAMTLTDNDAGSALWAKADPCPDDAALLAATAELEGMAAELLGHARRIIAACTAALEAAAREHREAVAALNAAKDPGGRAAAMDRIENAGRVIADCEAALEILAGCEGRLAHALDCLRRVRGDLASTYEVPYSFVHDGGKLPYDGDFLGGIVTIGSP